MSVRFFNSASEFRKWLTRNHNKAENIWLGFHKGVRGKAGFRQSEAVDEALCFGWIYSVVKSIDSTTYKIQFLRRKAKSAWSARNMKRLKELQKLGLVHPAGLRALKNRDREKSEEKPVRFAPRQLKRFKADEKAWAFFRSQTPSYQKYMIAWVTAAKKQETQEKRLEMLIGDSANGSKLARIVKANERLKKVYPPGETPIEEARNLGAVSGAELRSLGISTVEELRSVGWETAFYRLCEVYPHRANLNMLKSLIGAVVNQGHLKLDPELRAEAKTILNEFKQAR